MIAGAGGGTARSTGRRAIIGARSSSSGLPTGPRKPPETCHDPAHDPISAGRRR